MLTKEANNAINHMKEAFLGRLTTSRESDDTCRPKSSHVCARCGFVPTNTTTGSSQRKTGVFWRRNGADAAPPTQCPSCGTVGSSNETRKQSQNDESSCTLASTISDDMSMDEMSFREVWDDDQSSIMESSTDIPTQNDTMEEHETMDFAEDDGNANMVSQDKNHQHDGSVSPQHHIHVDGESCCSHDDDMVAQMAEEETDTDHQETQNLPHSCDDERKNPSTGLDCHQECEAENDDNNDSNYRDANSAEDVSTNSSFRLPINLLLSQGTSNSNQGSVQSEAYYYEGDVNTSGQPHGHGEMVFPNGDRYRGQVFNGKLHGNGTMLFAKGADYVGQFECGYMHGSGTFRYRNGDTYSGEFHNNKRHGQGRMFFSNGDLYRGLWREGHMHGRGQYHYHDGQQFEGKFIHGKRNGRGKHQWPDGSIAIDKFVNDQRVGEGVLLSPNRKRAWRRINGKRKERISTSKAELMVRAMTTKDISTNLQLMRSSSEPLTTIPE